MTVYRQIVVALAVTLALSVVVLSPSPVQASEGFEFIYFPHQGLDSEFSNDWGRPRGDDGERTHKGNDIFAPKLTPVVAVADGFVTFVGTTERPGKQVRIRHADGYETFYFHLNNDTPDTDDNRGGDEHAFAPGIEKGVFVAAGTVIGYVGDSGNAEQTPSHTHFELRRRGVAQNPYKYLRATMVRQKRVHENLATLGLS